jgi:hypothetical protein
MELIKHSTDFPSKYELELDEEELNIIKESLDSLHEHLLMVNKEDHEDETLLTRLMKIEVMCQKLGVPGYEIK